MRFEERLEVLQQCLGQIYPGVISDVRLSPLMPLLERCEGGTLRTSDLLDWQGDFCPVAWLNLLQSTLRAMDDWCERLGGDRDLLDLEHYQALQYFAALTANLLSYVALYDSDFIDYPLGSEDINRLAAKDIIQPTRLIGHKEFSLLYDAVPVDGGRHEALLDWLSGRRYFKAVSENGDITAQDSRLLEQADPEKRLPKPPATVGDTWLLRAESDKLSSEDVIGVLQRHGLVPHTAYRETKYLKPLGFKPGDSSGPVACGVLVVEKTKTANLWLLTADVAEPLSGLSRVDYPATSPSAERYGRNSNLQKIAELAYAPVSKFKIKTVAELRSVLTYLGRG
ncbi:hypothetical protein H744_1c1689 [Photobacterium gaetbulicola Gung47]|uniref:Uncharacterized protein n=1 Tax=Photobacterium gaetbulicola Gung47 TaxID=658445 RepID=A0A0C5WKE6_9GAMM|nr:hypothetical protein [Photobacterium gaetbulicola]AJR06707.1 hypothetical protein H744_1c1689 [Photobacterium gaetbulicola Gung47]